MFILDARRTAKKTSGQRNVTAGVAQGHEQFVSQRGDRSIARTRLARSPTYDLDVRGRKKSADDIGPAAPKQ